MLPFQDRQQLERYRDRWFGKFRAFVRDNNDPERLGRVRMEIPAVLGDAWSDWAYPCFPYGGSADTGMFLVPDEGATVWAEFEGGDVRYPIWVGVWYAGSDPGEQPSEACRVCDEATCQDCEDARDHAAGPDAAEHGKYSGHKHPPYGCPRVRVLLKTETGHTILADDKDGEELLEFIDRAGQMFRMLCPVRPDAQTDGQNRRGDRRADLGSQVSLDDLEDRRAGLQLLDVCGQELRFDAWRDEEKIILQSCDVQKSRWQRIVLDNTRGHERIEIMGLNGQQSVVIDSTSGAERIQLKDLSGSEVVLDGPSGNVVVTAANMVLIQ